MARAATSAGLKIIKVNELPTASADTVGAIYLVLSDTVSEEDYYTEHITIENGGVYSWELIGTTRVDLSNYASTEHTHTVKTNV